MVLFGQFVEIATTASWDTLVYTTRRLDEMGCAALLIDQMEAISEAEESDGEIPFQLQQLLENPIDKDKDGQLELPILPFDQHVLDLPSITIQNLQACIDCYGRLTRSPVGTGQAQFKDAASADVKQAHRCIWLLRRLHQLNSALRKGRANDDEYEGSKERQHTWSQMRYDNGDVRAAMRSQGYGSMLRFSTTVEELNEGDGLENDSINQDWHALQMDTERYNMYDDELRQARSSLGCIVAGSGDEHKNGTGERADTFW